MTEGADREFDGQTDAPGTVTGASGVDLYDQAGPATSDQLGWVRRSIDEGPVGTRGQQKRPVGADVPSAARLLTTLIERSGVSAVVIAERTPFDGPGKIGVSQVYYMISPERRSLPRKEDQVRGFGEACGLDELQIQRLLEMWQQLKNAPRAPARDRPAGSHQSRPARRNSLVSTHGARHAGAEPRSPAGEDLLRWTSGLGRDGVTDSRVCVAERAWNNIATALFGVPRSR